MGARKHGLGQGEEEEEDVGERLKSWRLSSACLESCDSPAPGGDVVFGKGPTGWDFVSLGKEIQPFLPSCVSQPCVPCPDSQCLDPGYTLFVHWELHFTAWGC